MNQLMVNRDECVGCCRCVDFAPEIFDVQDGLAFVKKQPCEQEQARAQSAIEGCPVEAICWKEERDA